MRRSLHLTAAHLALPLLLIPVACNRQPHLTDDALASAVQGRLQADTALSAEPIQMGVQNGVVTLTGAVSSPAARSLAANDAAAVAGVRTVVNNLTVGTPAPAQAEATLPTPPVETAPTPSPRQTLREQQEAKRQASRDAARARRSAAADQGTTVAQNTPAPVQQAPAPIQQAPPPTPPPAPVVHNITVPAGTVLPVRITQGLDSGSTQQGDSFSGSLTADLVIDSATVLRQGSNVSGRVTAVQEAAHFKGNSLLSVELTGVTRRGEHIALATEPYSVEGKGRGKNTLEKTGGGAAVGAILGGIFGGGKGAAIGAAAGGGAGAGVNGITRGQQVQIPAESLVRFRLSSPFSVKVTDSSGNSSAYPSSSPSPDTSGSGRRPLPQ